MPVRNPEHLVEQLDRAFNEGDLETLLSFYEDNAVVVTEPGKTARGRSELRAFFVWALAGGSTASQLQTKVIEADGVALFISRWTLTPKADPGQRTPLTLVATSVFRRQPDGGWKALIDNPFGPAILGG